MDMVASDFCSLLACEFFILSVDWIKTFTQRLFQRSSLWKSSDAYQTVKYPVAVVKKVEPIMDNNCSFVVSVVV